ncbi:AAA family ATPase [Chitinophaga sp. GbtcB8]|uniref:AAA family ATPase n=1 Tax=Chitinophaga sp. GbtcB8 TaxID=2824753 RepID=UPI001C2FCDE6|nr:AAA family ATPase [Chitinophaga sp. GbtcB8]
MKILTIRANNLTSLEGLTIIDFTAAPLDTAGIFAITGPMGAGKSTILDALCLALYAKTPRYLQAKETGIDLHDVPGSTINQGDVRGILRNGTAEGYAEADFVGVDGQHYRATWSVRRARNKATGSLQPFEIALKNLSTNTDIPGRKQELLDEIERKVGLNFEQFTRSVLLAQGDFATFLKAAKDDKSALLEKLTGTTIYTEISKRIFERHREEAQQLRDLNLQRQGIPTFTAEELESFTQRQAVVTTEIQAQEQQVDALNKEISWHQQLTALQAQLAAAGKGHQEAVTTRQSAVVREQKLKQVEQAQATRTWVDARKTTETQLTGKVREIEQLTVNINTLQHQKTEQDQLQQQAVTDLTAKNQAYSDATPMLEQAKKLDVQITERTDSKTQAANEVALAQKKHQQQQQLLQNKQTEATQLQSNIERSTQWKKENAGHQQIAEHQSLISAKLSDAQQLLGALQSLHTQISDTEKALASQQQGKENAVTQSITVQQQLQTAQQAYQTGSEKLAGIPIATLEHNKSQADDAVENTIKAQAHWRLLYTAQTDFNSLKQKLADSEKEYADKTNQLKEISGQLAMLLTQRETSQQMLNKARLAAAENVVSLRNQLIAEDPCPVCGSTEHPYATHNTQLDHVFKELEAAHQQNETAYTACFTTQNNTQAACNGLNKTIADLQKQRTTKEPSLLQLQQTWSGFAAHTDSMAIPDDQKTAWLQQQQQEKKQQQQSIRQQLQAYNLLKQQLDTQQQQLIQLEKQLAAHNNTIKDTERSLQSLNEQLAQQLRERDKSSTALSKTEQQLSPYFSAQDWFSGWKTNPQAFLDHINTVAQQWKDNSEQLSSGIQQHGILSATINTMQEQCQALLADLDKKQQQLTAINDQCQGLVQQRQTIFGGAAAANIEAGLKRAIEAAQQTLETQKDKNTALQTSITKILTQQEQTGKEIELLQQQQTTHTGKIQQWLSNYNTPQSSTMDEQLLLQLLELPAEWIDEERAVLRAMDDALTHAQSILNERTKQLEQHQQQQRSERQADELTQLLKDARAALQSAAEEKTGITLRLQQDTANRQQISQLLTTIEAHAQIVDNWAKLNEVIGAADGKKFRQIAQEYTLDVLLGYANKHLTALSRRYLLQRIPGTLGLQVADQDMGDEIRTVFSLSGGESFLVSLALALGLASLSSNQMQVESLFIDEGFGALDPATLSIAMDALERLHNQGRKVGVISHVQEMTERIPVQVKVSKQASGKSIVEVLSI